MLPLPQDRSRQERVQEVPRRAEEEERHQRSRAGAEADGSSTSGERRGERCASDGDRDRRRGRAI
eukprot:460648-Pyramimonas_sp.AAC.1